MIAVETGTVFGYGSGKIPLIRKNGGRVVVINGFRKRPEIGEEITYVIHNKKKGADFAYQSPDIPENLIMIRARLGAITTLWQNKFVQHLSEGTINNFNKDMDDIETKVRNEDYEGAAAIAHEWYRGSISETEGCEMNPIGWSYMDIARQFQGLEAELKRK